jgi:hypothetical protein
VRGLHPASVDNRKASPENMQSSGCIYTETISDAKAPADDIPEPRDGCYGLVQPALGSGGSPLEPAVAMSGSPWMIWLAGLPPV